MPILITPLADTRDTHALLDVRASLLAARAAIVTARSRMRSWTAAERVGDLISSLELEIEGVANTAEAVADEDEEREARTAEWHRCYHPYRRA